MADFGENFRGNRENVLCPFQCPDFDNQEHSYICEIIRKKVNIIGNYTDIFKEDIPLYTGLTVSKILKTRKALLEERYIEYSVFQPSQ